MAYDLFDSVKSYFSKSFQLIEKPEITDLDSYVGGLFIDKNSILYHPFEVNRHMFRNRSMDNIPMLVSVKCTLTDAGFLPGWEYFNQKNVSSLTRLTGDNYKSVISTIAPDEDIASKLLLGYEFFDSKHAELSEEKFYDSLGKLFVQ